MPVSYAIVLHNDLPSVCKSNMPKREAKKDALTSELEGFKPKKETEVQKINLGDGASLKRALDDAAAQVRTSPDQDA